MDVETGLGSRPEAHRHVHISHGADDARSCVGSTRINRSDGEAARIPGLDKLSYWRLNEPPGALHSTHAHLAWNGHGSAPRALGRYLGQDARPVSGRGFGR